jgi:hypothetical protein
MTSYPLSRTILAVLALFVMSTGLAAAHSYHSTPLMLLETDEVVTNGLNEHAETIGQSYDDRPNHAPQS